MPTKSSKFSYPSAARQTTVDNLHGVEVADPYRWLEDPTTEATQSWMSANDTLTRTQLAEQAGRKALTARLRELVYVDSISTPKIRGDRVFYSRRHKDKEKSILYFRKRDSGDERLLIDPHNFSDDGSASLRAYTISHDGKYIAYDVSESNRDETVTYVRGIDDNGLSDAVVNDELRDTRGQGVSWNRDGTGFVYSKMPDDPKLPEAKRFGFRTLRYHRVGQPQTQDSLVFPATADSTVWSSAGISRDGNWLVMWIGSGWKYNDIYVKDLRVAGATIAMAEKLPAPQSNATTREKMKAYAQTLGFTPIIYGQNAHYSLSIYKDTFYIETDEGAPNGRVFKADPKSPTRSAWQQIVPERKSVLESVDIIGGKLILDYAHNAHTELQVHDLDGTFLRKIELGGLVSGWAAGEPDIDDLYVGVSSFLEPTKIYRSSVSRGGQELWAKIDIPLDASRLHAEQKWFTSKDGTKVPIFIIHAKGLKKTGKTPTVLYGYGGFRVSLMPSFNPQMISWVENGGIWAIANLRGGLEFGEDWHTAGMLDNKQNVFDDFIAAAEFLIKDGYTRPASLAIKGGSNGGLLVGAAMTQRPDLFGAVVCGAPLLDMIRYHLFGAGKTWISEYGSAEDAAQFKTLLAYSPYHNIRPDTQYPALLMMSRIADDRVDPLHARKFTAAVQWAQTGPRPILFRAERQAGHGGADLRKARIAEIIDENSFLSWQLSN